MFRVARAALGLLLAAFLEAVAADATTLPSRKDAWIRIETAHFTLYSNASESKARDIGASLEKLRAVLFVQQSLPSGSPVPTSVFVFKSDSDLKPYKPIFRGRPQAVSGFFQASRDGNFIALAAGWSADPRPVIFHEYLHDFLHANFPRRPLWYDEGLAEFYSTFQATETEARVGSAVESHLRSLRRRAMLPLERLFAVRPDSPEYNEASRQGLFYAQSWALVHYLLRGEPRRAGQLARFLLLLEQGRPQEEAFREAFRADYSGLLLELSRYVRGSSFPYGRVTCAEMNLPDRTRTVPISYEEALFQLGDLLAHASPEHFEDAQAHFRGALDSNPSHAEALAGLGLLRMREEKYGEAGELFRRAIDAGSRNFHAYFHYGELAMQSLSSHRFIVGDLGADQRQIIEEARAAFRRSIELNPDFAEAHAALGRTYLVEEGSRVESGIRSLETALAKLPFRRDFVLDLVALYDRRGQEEKSEELLKLALGPEAEPVLAERKKAVEFQSSVNEVNSLLKAEKEQEAISLLEKIVSTAPPGMAGPLTEQLETLRRGAARNRTVREYNEAVARYNKRELEAALAGFQKVAADAQDPELARSAREQVMWVRRLLSRRPKTSSAPNRS